MTLNILMRSSFPTVLQSPINCGAVVMIEVLIIIPVVSLFTKKPNENEVEDMFLCYENKVLVPATIKLSTIAELINVSVLFLNLVFILPEYLEIFPFIT